MTRQGYMNLQGIVFYSKESAKEYYGAMIESVVLVKIEIDYDGDITVIGE